MLGRGVGTAPRRDAHSPRRHSRSTGTPPSQRRHEAQVRGFSRSPASSGVDGALSKQPSPAPPQPTPGTADRSPVDVRVPADLSPSRRCPTLTRRERHAPCDRDCAGPLADSSASHTQGTPRRRGPRGRAVRGQQPRPHAQADASLPQRAGRSAAVRCASPTATRSCWTAGTGTPGRGRGSPTSWNCWATCFRPTCSR